MVEGAIARFMEDATVDFRIGKGHSVSRDASSDRPRQSELDLVVDWESAPWYGHGRLVDEGPPVLAHIEVGLRSRSDKHKLNKDLERLRATIERAQAAGKKTWTAVVCLGSSHSPRETAELLGQWCGETAVSKARADDGTWWPIPDVIITPSHSWLKAEVMPTEATGPQPVWILQVGDPCEDDKLRKWRPLAFARAKLANYLAMRGRLTDEWLERPLESAHLGPRGRQGSLVAVAPCKAHYRCATWESGQRVYVLQVDPERRWELHCTGEAR